MKDILSFLSGLSANNNRDWFDSHRDLYQQCRKNFESFTEELIAGIQHFDPGIGAIKAKDCVFRIFRDTRFSNDKTPYKTNMGAFIARGGRKSPYSGYYIHLEPEGKSFAGGGLYMPPSESLKKVRQEIFYNINEFKAILQDKEFRRHFDTLDKMGDELKKAPQGYPPDWPDIELLKLKHYVVGEYLKDGDLTNDKFKDKALASFKAMHPLVSFTNRALGMEM
ncbi:MAG TPA: DUF2461 domain-containing protein [Bacteroidales bacterium]|nr:DUF2461 domain-containing protein [Bacteroidales bacterium]HSA43043.1 DUF2461 domain-containing protein [Bacteroidales bacterium]